MLNYAQDSQYSLTAIKLGFKAAFRSHLKMFNLLRDNTKVAVTITTAQLAIPCLLSNYNKG